MFLYTQRYERMNAMSLYEPVRVDGSIDLTAKRLLLDYLDQIKPPNDTTKELAR